MISEKRLATSPVQHVRDLMDSIKDGKITIGEYDPLELGSQRTFEVSCTSADADAVIEKYEALTSALEAIGAVHDDIDNGAKPGDVLTPDQLEVWNTYVRDFDEEFDAGEYDVDVIYEMRDSGAQLDEAEQDVIERHHEWYESQCLKRLPKKMYTPMLVVNRAQRYEFFARKNAPKTVMNEEGRCLAENLIVYYYCTNESH
jgi:hypothetical protein